MIDDLGAQVAEVDAKLRASGAEHPYVPLLLTVPGVVWVLALTIAAEIGEITRFPTPTKLTGYTGLCPRVVQSGESDRRGPLSKHGPRYLRWALLEGDDDRADLRGGALDLHHQDAVSGGQRPPEAGQDGLRAGLVALRSTRELEVRPAHLCLQRLRSALGDQLLAGDGPDPVGELVGLLEVEGGQKDRRVPAAASRSNSANGTTLVASRSFRRK